MTLPGQVFTIVDPGLGGVSLASNVPLVAGICSSGTAATLKSYSSIATLVSDNGYGPAVEDAASIMQKSGGPVRFCKIAQSSAGSVSATWTKSGSGPDITNNSSTPYYFYEPIITITTGGALATMKFKYSLDGGRTYSPIITSPVGGNYTIANSGINITFAAGTYVAADTYYPAAVTAPIYTSTELSAAVTGINASPYYWDFFVLSGVHAAVATAVTISAALAGHIATWHSKYKFISAICDAASADSSSNVAAGYTTADRWIMPCYGYADTTSAVPIVGCSTPRHTTLTHAAVRATSELISTHLGRVASGALAGIPGPTTDFPAPLSYDENENDLLDQLGITTIRSFYGLPGYYLTGGRIKPSFGSDFTDWHKARVFNTARRVTYQLQAGFQNRSFRTNSDGTIDKRDAGPAQERVQKALEAVLINQYNAEGVKGHVSAVRYTIDTTNNINSTKQLLSEVAILPLGYAEFISTKMGFALNV
jgi:hypothetical protein